MPHVIVIAGANGAGKSTVAPILLRDTLGISEFVNADCTGLIGFHARKSGDYGGQNYACENR